MTDYFWETLKLAVNRCNEAYERPTNRFGNEQVVFTENHTLTTTIAGSNDVWDWIQNLDVRQVPLGDWFLSKGVLDAAKNVMAMVHEYRNDNPQSYIKQLIFEGHSKGGAVAIACALLAHARGLPVGRVTAFGAPRITTTKIIYPFPVDRVEAHGDVVTKVPVWRPWRPWRVDGRRITIGQQTVASVGCEWLGWLGRPVKNHLIKHYLKIME